MVAYVPYECKCYKSVIIFSFKKFLQLAIRSGKHTKLQDVYENEVYSLLDLSDSVCYMYVSNIQTKVNALGNLHTNLNIRKIQHSKKFFLFHKFVSRTISCTKKKN
jgi:hypothetical protein